MFGLMLFFTNPYHEVTFNNPYEAFTSIVDSECKLSIQVSSIV